MFSFINYLLDVEYHEEVVSIRRQKVSLNKVLLL